MGSVSIILAHYNDVTSVFSSYKNTNNAKRDDRPRSDTPLCYCVTHENGSKTYKFNTHVFIHVLQNCMKQSV